MISEPTSVLHMVAVIREGTLIGSRLFIRQTQESSVVTTALANINAVTILLFFQQLATNSNVSSWCNKIPEKFKLPRP